MAHIYLYIYIYLLKKTKKEMKRNKNSILLTFILAFWAHGFTIHDQNFSPSQFQYRSQSDSFSQKYQEQVRSASGRIRRMQQQWYQAQNQEHTQKQQYKRGIEIEQETGFSHQQDELLQNCESQNENLPNALNENQQKEQTNNFSDQNVDNSSEKINIIKNNGIHNIENQSNIQKDEIPLTQNSYSQSNAEGQTILNQISNRLNFYSQNLKSSANIQNQLDFLDQPQALNINNKLAQGKVITAKDFINSTDPQNTSSLDLINKQEAANTKNLQSTGQKEPILLVSKLDNISENIQKQKQFISALKQNLDSTVQNKQKFDSGVVNSISRSLIKWN